MARTPAPQRKTTRSQAKMKKSATNIRAKKARSSTLLKKLLKKRQSYLARRPHRSFRKTFRRDYVRSLELPGYIAFTRSVAGHLIANKRIFGISILSFSLISALLVGVASQDVYSQSVDILKQTSTSIFTGGWGELGKGALLLASIAGGNFDSEHSDAQQIYAMLVFLLLWLSTVWLLRTQLAGHTPNFRDSLYNSAAPLVPTILIALLFVIQLVPAAIALIIYQVGSASLTGIVAMLVFLVALLLVILSLYWITSTFIALIVITLPGMYPWRAIRIAGDLVIGRRIRILARFIWGLICTALLWGSVMIPTTLFAIWLQNTFHQTSVLPIVPMMLVLTSSLASIFIATYCYMLYRKIVDDEASPA